MVHMAPPRTRTNVSTERVLRLQTGIAALEDGAGSVTVDGVNYGASQVDAMYTRLDWLSVKAAIEAIEQGAQRYSVLGRVFEKADLKTLYDHEKQLRLDAVRTTRGGTRILNPVVVS